MYVTFHCLKQQCKKNMVRNDFYPTNIILGGVFFLHDIMEKLYWDKGGEKWQ